MSRDHARTVLSHQGRRMTRQRQTVLDVLRGTDCHPDAYWVYEEVRRRIPNVSLGTVYRSLKVLGELNLVRELTYGDRHSRYDGNTSRHGHVTCIRCHRIVDVSLPQNGDLNRRAEAESGFTIESVRIEFEGICPECAAKLRNRTKEGENQS
jgi:Fur family peroxide stress response transcriptional regulator